MRFYIGLQKVLQLIFFKIHLKEGESVEADPVSMSRLESRSEGVGADEVPGHKVAVRNLLKYHLR